MKSLFEVLSMLHSILMSNWFHFVPQNRFKVHQNVDPKRLPIMHPFSLHFWIPKTSLLGGELEPSWPSVSPQDGPRDLPDPSRCVPELLPEGTQDGSQDGFKVHSWSIVDRFVTDVLIYAWSIVHWFFMFFHVSVACCILVDCGARFFKWT